MKPSSAWVAGFASLAAGLAAAQLAACGKGAPSPAGHGGSGGDGSGGCGDVPGQIFLPHCGTAACHGTNKPAQGLDLASPGLADRVVNKPGNGCGGVLANPSYPASSLLYKKLLAMPSCGARMPINAPPLGDAQIACVKAWIAAQQGGMGGGGGVGGGAGGFGGEGGSGGAGTCSDGIKNGIETGTDCGGLCPLCPLGEGCAGPTDCESFACEGGSCVASSCEDMTQNGAETDTDCGGPTCPACAGGEHCLDPTDCASMDCQPNGICASSCADGLKDGLEKGIDCGGVCPVGCAGGTPCAVATDCESALCVSGVCTTPACDDMVTNGGESDVDCGGPCAPCPLGGACNTTLDCAAGGCVGGFCADILLISEIRTSGKDGNKYSDEFIELYNPGATPITMDSSWKVMHRSAQGGCQDAGYGNTVYIGSGLVVPSHRHLLITGSGYLQAPPADALVINPPLYGSIGDAGSVSLLHNNQLVDTVCFYYDAASMSSLTNCPFPYSCNGAPVNNLPHNGSGQGASASDASIERKPGGALGNGQNTGDNAADFTPIAPAKPQDLASPPTP